MTDDHSGLNLKFHSAQRWCLPHLSRSPCFWTSWSFLNRSIYRSCLHFALQFHVMFQFHLPSIQFFLKLLVVLRIVEYSPLSLPIKWLTMSNNLCKRKVFLKMAAQVTKRLKLQPSDWKASFLMSSTLSFYNMMVENPKGSELFSTTTILVHRFVESFPLTVTSLTSLPTSHMRCHIWVLEALIPPQSPGYRFQSAPGTNNSNVLKIFRFEAANMQEWNQILKWLIIIYCAVSLNCFLPVPSQFQHFQDWSLQIFKNILTTASIQACPMEDFSRPKGASVRRDRSFSRNISPLLSKSFKCLAMSWVIPVLVAAYLQRHVHLALTFTDIPNGPCFPLTYQNPPINMKVEMTLL